VNLSMRANGGTPAAGFHCRFQTDLRARRVVVFARHGIGRLRPALVVAPIVRRHIGAAVARRKGIGRLRRRTARPTAPCFRARGHPTMFPPLGCIT
jgi:hypothetical protein